MKVQILGGGCANCNKLAKNTENALAELGISAEIEKVTDMSEIMSYGVMSTPALVVNDEVKIAGRTSAVSEIKELLEAVKE